MRFDNKIFSMILGHENKIFVEFFFRPNVQLMPPFRPIQNQEDLFWIFMNFLMMIRRFINSLIESKVLCRARQRAGFFPGFGPVSGLRIWKPGSKISGPGRRALYSSISCFSKYQLFFKLSAVFQNVSCFWKHLFYFHDIR